MSNRYTADGRRKSSMTHATRGHQCTFCDQVSYGNGGQVSHARGHVRRGEAVELVKYYQSLQSPSRLFVPVAETWRIEKYISEGFERVTT